MAAMFRCYLADAADPLDSFDFYMPGELDQVRREVELLLLETRCFNVYAIHEPVNDSMVVSGGRRDLDDGEVLAVDSIVGRHYVPFWQL